MKAAVNLNGGGGTLLDIGCADGSLQFPFRTRSSQLMESPPPRLELTRTIIFDGRFRPILVKAERIPEIASNSADLNTSADMIGHIPDIYSATPKVHGGIKAEGTQPTNMPDMAYLARHLPRLWGQFLSISHHWEDLCSAVHLDSGRLHHFTFRILTLLLQNVAFCVIGRMGCARFGGIHRICPRSNRAVIQLSVIEA